MNFNNYSIKKLGDGLILSHCCQSYLKLTISYILSLTFKAFITDPSYDLNLFEVYFLNYMYYMSEILHKIFYTVEFSKELEKMTFH